MYNNHEKGKSRLLTLILIITLISSFFMPITADESDNPINFGSSLDLKAELIWDGVPATVTVPDVGLQLVRSISEGVYENVGLPVFLGAGTTEHVFTLEAGTSAETYDVRLTNYDSFKNDYEFSIVPVSQGFKITLTYAVKTKIDALAKIEWTGGKPFNSVGYVKPGNFSIQLYKNGSPLKSFIINQDIMDETPSGWIAEHLFEDLDRFDDEGIEYTYTIGSGSAPRYSQVVEGMMIRFSLKPVPKSITIKKIWRGGPEQKPTATINLQLRQSTIIKETLPVLFDNPTQVESINGIEIWEETKTVIVETNRFSSFSAIAKEVAVPGYKTASPIAGNWVNGFRVTNIYQQDITANKVWNGGPQMKLPVQFKLKRQAGPDGLELQTGYLKTLNPGVSEVTWSGRGTEVTNDAGVPYRYWIEEVTVLENYVKSEENLTVTNTYVSPKTDVTVSKTWINGPEEKPTIEFQLFQNNEPYDEPVELVAGVENHTWTDLDLTDFYGNNYEYTVEEVSVPQNYVMTTSEDGLTITNTYVSPKIDVTVSKIWINGPQEKPAIEIQLLRNNEPYLEPVVLVNGQENYTWLGLDQTNEFGEAYIYAVDEVSVPNNYRQTTSENGLVITNTYVSPLIDVEANKIWVDAPAVKPTIQFQLLQNDEPYGEPIELINGVTSYVWENLEQTDSDGVPYVYTVEEVSVPQDYQMSVSEDGLTITNTYGAVLGDDDTYVSPLIDISLTKVWVGGPSIKPTVQFQLYQDNNALGKAIELVHGQLRHTWKDLKETDPEGIPYVYTVKEINVPEGYDVSVSKDGLTITNTYGSVLGDSDSQLPTTGSSNVVLFSLLILLSGLGLLVLSKKKATIK